ncbi:uncharacterized protein RAG0_07613 [Rhynchosporium agropyri]|uniref:Uncharacterized protein n=1 Tax=Rhynchosporium agropyri TaxID=914238 RepID=A0A1E1KMA4_9HELO|nr:uncharacterized protein RAG0_07613 [Rhynchosporium agropyri]
MASKSLRPWEDVAFKKQAECLALIPSAWIIPPSLLKDISLGPESDTNGIALDIPRKSGILATTELAIAEGYNARELAAKLGAGELSSEEALPFSKRAAIAQQLFNCLTETFFHRIGKGEISGRLFEGAWRAARSPPWPANQSKRFIQSGQESPAVPKHFMLITEGTSGSPPSLGFFNWVRSGSA